MRAIFLNQYCYFMLKQLTHEAALLVQNEINTIIADGYSLGNVELVIWHGRWFVRWCVVIPQTGPLTATFSNLHLYGSRYGRIYCISRKKYSSQVDWSSCISSLLLTHSLYSIIILIHPRALAQSLPKRCTPVLSMPFSNHRWHHITISILMTKQTIAVI